LEVAPVEERPTEVLVEECKDAIKRLYELTALMIATLPPSFLKKEGLQVLDEQARQRAKAEYRRLGGHKEWSAEYERVKSRRDELRRMVAERLAQREGTDASTERILEDIREHIVVKRKGTSAPEELGKIPRLLDGKAVRALLRRWFGEGTYELHYVRDYEDAVPTDVAV
jgi:hypothetical protein